MFPGMGGGRRARPQPAARRDGRRRRPAVHAAVLDEPRSTRSSTRRTSSLSGLASGAAAAARPSRAPSRSTSSAPPTSRSTCSTRRSSGRAAWAGTSGSARRPRRTARTSSSCTWPRSRTTRTSTPTKRRDELARITNGYSPAMIEQVCSMALTYAHSDGPRAVRVAGHRRGDDHDRVGHRDQASTTCPTRRARSPSTRPATPPPPRLHGGRAVDAAVDPQARRLARPPPGDREGGALLLLALRGDGAAHLDARRDGGRARLLRRELDRRRRRRAERDRPRGAGWSARAAWGPSASTLNGRFASRRGARTRSARRS